MGLIKSPCVLKCYYDYDHDLCTGCGRDITELTDWNYYDNQKKQEIIKKSKKRLDQYQELSYNSGSKGG